jgi:hypothetical protein
VFGSDWLLDAANMMVERTHQLENLATVVRLDPDTGQTFLDQLSRNAMSMPEGSRIIRLRLAKERLSFA